MYSLGSRRDPGDSEGKAFLAEKTAGAKALGQECFVACEALEAGACFADKEAEAQGHCLKKMEWIVSSSPHDQRPERDKAL